MSNENVEGGEMESTAMAADDDLNSSSLGSSVHSGGGSTALRSETSISGEESISPAEKDVLRTVIKKLVACPLSDMFLKPVVEFYPEVSQNYLAIIKTPIDLRTVWRCLQNGAYDNRENGICKIRKDLLNVFNNCILFNEKASNMQLVSIARHLKVLLNDLMAETGLPLLKPRESEADIAMRRWKRRRRRYIDCWGIPAKTSVRDAVAEYFPEVSSRLLLSQESVDEDPDCVTFGDVVVEAAQVVGIEFNDVQPPSTTQDGSSRLDDANAAGVGSSLARMVEVLFPAPKAAAAAAANDGSDMIVDNDNSNDSSKGNELRWEALNEKLSEITIFMSEIARRGSELSTIWARPQELVWAKAARQHVFWPAITLCSDSMPQNAKIINFKRLPHKLLSQVETSLKDEIDWESESCGGSAYQGGTVSSRISTSWVLVEFLGVNDFAWIDGNSSGIKQLTNIEKTPNTKPIRKKLYPAALSEAQRALDNRDGGCGVILTDRTLTDSQIEVAMAKAGWNEKINTAEVPPLEEECDYAEEEEEENLQLSTILNSVLIQSAAPSDGALSKKPSCNSTYGGSILPLDERAASLQERARARVYHWLSDSFGPEAFAPPEGAKSRLSPEQQALSLLRWKAEKDYCYDEGVCGIAQNVGSNTDIWAQLLDEEARGRYSRPEHNETGSDSATEDEWGAEFGTDLEKYMLCVGRKVILRRQLAVMQQLESDLRKRLEEEEIILGPNALKAIKVVEMFEKKREVVDTTMDVLSTEECAGGGGAAATDSADGGFIEDGGSGVDEGSDDVGKYKDT